MIFFVRFLRQSQSQLDEVAGSTGESDGLGDISSTQPPLTTPLERADILPQLSRTLEHTVRQLNVLTQVRDDFCYTYSRRFLKGRLWSGSLCACFQSTYI